MKSALSANEGIGRWRRLRGYTLIELIIVMAIISILLATAVPMYQKSLMRTKESLLKNNLFTLRTVIDEYTFDKQKAPQTLQDLVDQGYLRGVPLDPITGSNQTWRVIMEDAISTRGPDAAGDLRCAQRVRSEEPRRHRLFGVVSATAASISGGRANWNGNTGEPQGAASKRSRNAKSEPANST